SVLAGGVTALEHDQRPQPLLDGPGLGLDQQDLQAFQLGFIGPGLLPHRFLHGAVPIQSGLPSRRRQASGYDAPRRTRYKDGDKEVSMMVHRRAVLGGLAASPAVFAVPGLAEEVSPDAILDAVFAENPPPALGGALVSRDGLDWVGVRGLRR